MINYFVQGKGLPIVLIHGYLENHKMWKDISAELSKEQRVIMPDLPGHGSSASIGSIHDMESMAKAVVEVMDHLEIDKFAVIGHSMGGYITLALADLFPKRIKGFLLMNSSSLADTEEKKGMRTRAIELAEKDKEALIKMSIPLLFSENNAGKLIAEKEFTRLMMRETSLDGIRAALRGMSKRPDRTYVLKEFQGPIGIILGVNDRTVDPLAFKNIIPKKENITVLKLDCGHMSYFENPKETIDFVKEFVNKTNAID